MTEEQWLAKLISRLRPRFRRAGYKLPRHIGVHCGWPTREDGSARGDRTRFDAECHPGKIPQIFVSPRLDDSIYVGHCVVHELVHALPIRGHRKDFFEAAEAVGLVPGKRPRAATDASPELREFLAGVVREIGEYPHKALKP